VIVEMLRQLPPFVTRLFDPTEVPNTEVPNLGRAQREGVRSSKLDGPLSARVSNAVLRLNCVTAPGILLSSTMLLTSIQRFAPGVAGRQTRLGYRTSRAPAVQRDPRRLFGRGANNASFFAIPVGIAAGPDQTPGALERSAVIHFADRHITISIFALIKDDSDCHRESGLERADLQFRAELFNFFNIVNMGLTCEPHRGYRVWQDQQDRGNLTANYSFR